MRIPKAILALAAVSAPLLAGCSSAATGSSSSAAPASVNSAAATAPAASPTSEKASSPAAQSSASADTSGLPPWQTSAPGDYQGKIFMPTDAVVIQTITGSGTDINDPVLYNLVKLGNGAQVRFTCSGAKLSDTVHYFSMTVGRDMSNYEAVPADGTSGSFFFNWDWLGIGDGVKGLIYAWGDCKWQIRILTFKPQPLPSA